jgi:hypothetical protein
MTTFLRPASRWLCLALVLNAVVTARGADDWMPLFDGQTLAGWKAAEHPDTFKVVDGTIVGHGPRSHLFYLGADGKAEFENFELALEIKAEAGANSGVYFHTKWQDSGWPAAGFEAQVNNTQPVFEKNYIENKKSGSLYGIRNVYKSLVRDGEWYTMYIRVQRPRVEIRLNGRVVTEYTEPANPVLPVPGPKLNLLGKGTFALQGHDEKSQVRYRNIRVRRLPPGEDASVTKPVLDDQGIRRLVIGKDNFPLVDLHTHLKGGLTLAQVIATGHRTGMKAGIAANGGLGFPIQNDAAALAFLASLQDEPVFVGLQAEGREWLTLFSPQTRAAFDYVFTDAMTWTNRAGRRQRLWIPAETDIGPDVQDFMEQLTAQAEQIIANEPIDIYVNPTFLPEAIAARYDELWTEARMQRIIAATVKHGVAIELNCRYRLPSEKFVRLAKAAGARFTIGTNNTGGDDWGDWSYAMDLQQKCGLTWRNMWVPGHEPTRAQRALLSH